MRVNADVYSGQHARSILIGLTFPQLAATVAEQQSVCTSCSKRNWLQTVPLLREDEMFRSVQAPCSDINRSFPPASELQQNSRIPVNRTNGLVFVVLLLVLLILLLLLVLLLLLLFLRSLS